jgi:hypothetical protein
MVNKDFELVTKPMAQPEPYGTTLFWGTGVIAATHCGLGSDSSCFNPDVHARIFGLK